MVVTNPDGQTQTTTYTYVTPVFSDFNGTWQGYAGDEGENVFALTVRDNVLVSLTCGGITLDFSSPPSTASGEFAVKEPLGAVTGGLLRSDHAEGDAVRPRMHDLRRYHLVCRPAIDVKSIGFANRRDRHVQDRVQRR